MLALVLLVGLVGPSLGRNLTEEEEGDRTAKQNVGIFNVVKFPNIVCTGSNSLNGTCYTASECTAKGGTSSGSCASGFGVCCVFSLACGGSASENNTYVIKSAYSVTTDADPCKYTICKLTPNICKLRLDFETFVLSQPATYVTSATEGEAGTNGLRLGSCIYDSLSITNPGGIAPPVICGTNTGQHMYIPASDSCHQLSFDIGTGYTGLTRSWQIKVTQYECGSWNYPDMECLQWHTGTSGTFRSFGWDLGVTTVTQTSHTHLQNQYYDVCFRRERGYCSLCFTPQIYVTSISLSSYGVSMGFTGVKSAVDTLCGLSAAIAAGTPKDYIEVVNLQPSIGAAGTNGANKICGAVFDANAISADQAAALPATDATACTFSTPFKWGVRFDGEELQLITGDETAANALNIDTLATAPTTGHGVGSTGFYMAFWQNTC